jgi:hypothetical protein
MARDFAFEFLDFSGKISTNLLFQILCYLAGGFIEIDPELSLPFFQIAKRFLTRIEFDEPVLDSLPEIS